MQRFRIVEGDVLETLPAQAPAMLSVLRLDTDWYVSTKHELEQLYPRLLPGGVLIVDDYGYWRGARKATDDYFQTLHARPLLHRIDYTGRICVKPLVREEQAT
jgi:predicted O-methyltransferase YrrM